MLHAAQISVTKPTAGWVSFYVEWPIGPLGFHHAGEYTRRLAKLLRLLGYRALKRTSTVRGWYRVYVRAYSTIATDKLWCRAEARRVQRVLRQWATQSLDVITGRLRAEETKRAGL